MAIQFGGNAYINTVSTPVNGYPITLSCWAYLQANLDIWFFRIHDTAASQNYFMIYISNNLAYAIVRVNAGIAQSATASYTANTWIHLCAVFTSTTSRTIYVNGVGTTTTATATNTSSTNLTQVRLGFNASVQNSQMAEAAIWDSALTAAEVSSLSKGFQSNLIRPDNLVFYAPLIRDRNEISEGRTLTSNATITTVEHPRIYGL